MTPGEELWVKIIDLDLARRRISLSIKQAAEGGELAPEYRDQFKADEQGNWVGTDDATREAAGVNCSKPKHLLVAKPSRRHQMQSQMRAQHSRAADSGLYGVK